MASPGAASERYRDGLPVAAHLQRLPMLVVQAGRVKPVPDAIPAPRWPASRGRLTWEVSQNSASSRKRPHSGERQHEVGVSPRGPYGWRHINSKRSSASGHQRSGGERAKWRSGVIAATLAR